MSIEEKNINYSSHKHKYNVYVEINSKTKLGEDLLKQYHEQTKYQYMDVGRIGYHDEYGRYIIDYYTVKELIVVPKLILRVRKMAMDRAGRDVYELRTYMSKFGQLNFLVIVDKDKADLILVENIYIENLNHREDYETLLWRLSYYNQQPVPMAEIFYKFGIKANPDDYGRAWKAENTKINNLIVSLAKAEMTKQIANKVASATNQKVLVTSLNYLNKEGDYGKKITKAYSENVAKNKELNKLSSTPKLDNTLNQVLIKTIDANTTKKDVKDKTNFKLYKKVVDAQFTCPLEIQRTVKQANTKQNLKQFVAETYKNSKATSDFKTDNAVLFNAKQEEFEKIIDSKFDKKPNEEASSVVEEKIDTKKLAERKIPKEFRDFQNKVVEVNIDPHRFHKDEEPIKQKQRERDELLSKKQREKAIKLNQKRRHQIKALNAECDLDKEFERSKAVLGLTPGDSKKKKKKILDAFFSDDKADKKREKKNKKAEKVKKTDDHDNILQKIAKKIKNEESGKEETESAKIKSKKKESKENLKREKIAKKQNKKEKQLVLKQQKQTKKHEEQEEKKRKKLLKIDLAKSKKAKKKEKKAEKKSAQLDAKDKGAKPIKKVKEKKTSQNKKFLSAKKEETATQSAYRPVVKPAQTHEGAEKKASMSYAAQIKQEAEEKERKRKATFAYDPTPIANNEPKQKSNFDSIKQNILAVNRERRQTANSSAPTRKSKDRELGM